MTTPTTLLAEAKRLGIDLIARGDRLGYDGPGDAVTSGFLSALAAHKVELLAMLAAEPSTLDPGPAPTDPTNAAAWWLARYKAAGVEPPREMIDAASGRRDPDIIPTHPGWPNDLERRGRKTP